MARTNMSNEQPRSKLRGIEHPNRNSFRGKPRGIGPAEIELSTAEAKLFVKLAGEATEVDSTEDFKEWTQTSVRKLFPHEMLIAGVAQRNGARVEVDRLLSAGFPLAFINAVTARCGAFACPTLDSWFNQGRPQLYEPAKTQDSTESDESSSEFKNYDLKNVAAHGVADLSGRYATYFSFSQIPESLNLRHAKFLELLVPQLHHAFVRATNQPFAYLQHATELADGFGLTTREQRVLYGLWLGKTNDEIGHATRRAPDTVKHQVSSILAKLNVRTRSEAVALAVRIGMLPERRNQVNGAHQEILR